ncbi:MAG: ubiquinone/menaquinone biosynthesis methyltransferase [Deltaproteobacteria bacterium]|nr:ubiquinone/menaquinone biosynthesis methyltransferase [Deltaproteobacteria bacterium]
MEGFKNRMNVKELFSNISGTYDLLNRVLSMGTDKRWRKKGTKLLPHGKNLRILDLASGTLDLTLQYAKQGDGEIYCVDFALPMLMTGRTKVSPVLDHRIHLICGNGMGLPFPGQFFDAAMCAWGMRNFSDPLKGLKEAQRVLKPGASLLVIDFFKPSRSFSKIFSRTYGKYIIPTLGSLISGNKAAYDYLYNSVEGFYTRFEYENLLEQAGFEIIVSKDLTGGISSLILANANTD